MDLLRPAARIRAVGEAVAVVLVSPARVHCRVHCGCQIRGLLLCLKMLPIDPDLPAPVLVEPRRAIVSRQVQTQPTVTGCAGA